MNKYPIKALAERTGKSRATTPVVARLDDSSGGRTRRLGWWHD